MLRTRLLYIFVLITAITGCHQHTTDLIGYIDTRVGTAPNSLKSAGKFGKGSEELGQTLPAVFEPNGMNFWTPQTQDTEVKCKAPYYYQDSLFQGFRNSHWIVGGCTQDYGSMTLFPATNVNHCIPEQRACLFNHTEETATPSYYAVRLQTSGIKAEMTARSRSAIFRLTYPTDSAAYLIINPNSDEGEGYIELDTTHKEIRGYNPIHRIYQGKGLPAGHKGFFVIHYTDELETFGTYRYDSLYNGHTSIGNAHGIGLYVKFRRSDLNSPIIIKAASSFTGIDGARKNLDAEIPHFEFSQTHAELTDIWNRHLSKMQVTSRDTTLLRKFYGAFYRASFLPRTINDVNGCYPTFSSGQPIVCTTNTSNQYDDFSMWDTFRALHPLLNIISPHKNGEMMQSLIDKYEQGGWLPIFPCWNSYTAAMIGDHCTATICDAYIKGVRNFDILKAYEAMRKNAFETPDDYHDYANGMGRRALNSYLHFGYIPLEDSVKEAYHKQEQTSRTLEYAYDDFALAQVAKALNRQDDYEQLSERSLNYRHVIDPQTGYANGRYANGTFHQSNNPFIREPYITEGAPCHYTWFVPHDPKGLMQTMGGKEVYTDKLDTLFEQKLYWHGNEPCHHIAYMYGYADETWKTQKYVRDILDAEYADTPGGLSGNDDAGQMSAWYIFSSLGFYPVCPAGNEYIIGCPTFEKATIRLENGKTFTIIAKDADSEHRYIQSAKLNGETYNKNYITHEDIMRGGTMTFEMGTEPNKSWGRYDQ